MFKISSKAHSIIVAELSLEELTGMLPHVTWEEMRNDKITKRWIVGFIKRERVVGREAEFIHEICGIEFVIDGPQRYLKMLEGTTLDVKNGAFIFIPARTA